LIIAICREFSRQT